MNIFITGARSYVAWSMLKIASKQEKLHIYLGDTNNKSLCFKSNIFDVKVIFPSPRFNFEEFKIFILNYIEINNINIIYPTCEEVFYFSIIKKDLKNIGCELFTADITLLKELHSKYRFNKMLNNFEIGIPETKIINKKSDLNKYKKIDKKYIFKYEYSRFANNIYTNFKSNFNNIDNIGCINSKLLVQEYIEGKSICSFGIAKQGKIVSNIVYENKLSYKGGAGTYLKSFFHKKINNFVTDFVEKNNFHGFISFDFIENSEKIYVIECNPRVTSGIHLYDDSKKFSNIIFKNDKYNQFFSNKISHKSFVLANIFFNFKHIFNYSKAFKIKSDVLFFEKKILFYQVYILFYYFILAIINKKTITEISSSDIEYNG